jgi:transcriptional regulator with XRE-family HTH domain
VNATPEEQLGQLISEIGLDVFPADVQKEAEEILSPGQALEPAARARLVSAAKRGARRVALTHSSLEVLLFNARRDQSREAEEIAGMARVDADTIQAIERGERNIDSEKPQDIAAWVRSVGIDHDLVTPALRKSLGTWSAVASYSGEGELRLTAEQEEFVQRVARALDDTNDADTNT